MLGRSGLGGGDGVSVTSYTLRRESLRASEHGAHFDIMVPWYRSLPVSSIVGFEVSLAGEPVPADRVRLSINGAESALEQLANRWDEFWFIQHPATVRGGLDEPLVEGREIDVAIAIEFRVPYMVAPDGTVVTQRSEAQAPMHVLPASSEAGPA